MANATRSVVYMLPTDEPEAERLNYQHWLLLETFGGLFRAPLEGSQVLRVLDIGCGTGNWAIDLAKQHPNATVIGIDLNEDPQWATAPSNCKFRVADMEKETTWDGFEESFDYIHGRFIVPGIRHWSDLLARCFDHLSNEGWLELQDFGFPMGCESNISKSDSKLMTFSDFMEEGMLKNGLHPGIAGRFPELLSEVGFVQPKLESFKMIMGPWPEDERERNLGQMGLKNWNLGLRGFSEKLFTGVLGWSVERFEKFIEETLKELNDGRYRIYLPLKVCFAQKPAKPH